MKKSIENKARMYQTVLDLCRNNAGLWNGVPAFVLSVEKLDVELQLLRDNITQQGNRLLGVKDQKTTTLQPMYVSVFVLKKALYMHGSSTSNLTLQARHKQSLSTLVRLSTTKLVAACDELRTDINSYGAQLADFGISDTTISQTLGLIQAGIAALMNPRNAIIERKGLTFNLDASVRNIDKLLKERLDLLMLSFNTLQPSFYQSYKNARIIIDLHGKYKTTPPLEKGSDSLE